MSSTFFLISSFTTYTRNPTELSTYPFTLILLITVTKDTLQIRSTNTSTMSFLIRSTSKFCIRRIIKFSETIVTYTFSFTKTRSLSFRIGEKKLRKAVTTYKTFLCIAYKTRNITSNMTTLRTVTNNTTESICPFSSPLFVTLFSSPSILHAFRFLMETT